MIYNYFAARRIREGQALGYYYDEYSDIFNLSRIRKLFSTINLIDDITVYEFDKLIEKDKISKEDLFALYDENGNKINILN